MCYFCGPANIYYRFGLLVWSLTRWLGVVFKRKTKKQTNTTRFASSARQTRLASS